MIVGMVPTGHMEDAVHRYILHGIDGGSFFTAVLRGSIESAILRADHVNHMRISSWMDWRNNLPDPVKSPAWHGLLNLNLTDAETLESMEEIRTVMYDGYMKSEPMVFMYISKNRACGWVVIKDDKKICYYSLPVLDGVPADSGNAQKIDPADMITYLDQVEASLKHPEESID